MDEKESRGRDPLTRTSLAYLVLTALLCGALVMVIEVMGSRVIGPFFGVSLYVWTSLITVTLIALAAGYAAGGVLADRAGSADSLYLIVFLAGLGSLLVPVLKSPVLKLCFPLGLRLGAFASALLLFGPALFLLGCVSPYLVKIAASQLQSIGRTVGGFYALSTIGSVAGTVLTGFFLIEHLGVGRIFGVTGALLIGLAAGYFLVFRRRWWVMAAVALPVALFPSGYRPGLSRVLENGTRVTSIAAAGSYYGSLKVVDYTFRDIHTRELIIDGMIQGGIDMRTGESIHPYTYFLERIPRALHPEGESCLVIGAGAGTIPKGYERSGVRTDVVDIDSQVIDLAREYFGFSVGGDVVIADARYFLATSRKQYDFVILDVFTGDTTPGHLISREALSLLKDRLTERGVAAINLAGSLGAERFMTASVVRTLQTVFDQVEIYPTFPYPRGKGRGNLAVVAYSGPPRRLEAERLAIPPLPRLARRASGPLGRRFQFPEGTAAIVLTDDYNPIDVYEARLREGVREDILEGTHWDVLIESF